MLSLRNNYHVQSHVMLASVRCSNTEVTVRICWSDNLACSPWHIANNEPCGAVDKKLTRITVDTKMLLMEMLLPCQRPDFVPLSEERDGLGGMRLSTLMWALAPLFAIPVQRREVV